MEQFLLAPAVCCLDYQLIIVDPFPKAESAASASATVSFEAFAKWLVRPQLRGIGEGFGWRCFPVHDRIGYHLVVTNSLPWKDPPCYYIIGINHLFQLGPSITWRTVGHNQRVWFRLPAALHPGILMFCWSNKAPLSGTHFTPKAVLVLRCEVRKQLPHWHTETEELKSRKRC